MLLSLRVISSVNTDSENVLTKDKGVTIKGQINERSFPLPCRVRLFERMTGRLIADIATDQNGFYQFDHLTKLKFFIVAHHPKNQFNAVIQDNVVPK